MEKTKAKAPDWTKELKNLITGFRYSSRTETKKPRNKTLKNK